MVTLHEVLVVWDIGLVPRTGFIDAIVFLTFEI